MLGNWIDSEGRISREYRSSAAWRAAHTFLWDLPTVERFAARSAEGGISYLAGIAGNVYDAAQFFDGVIALGVSGETLLRRQNLPHRVTAYPYLAPQNSLEDLEAAVLTFERRMREQGAELVNAEQGIARVADAVIGAAEGIVGRAPRRQPHSRRRR